MTDSYQDGPQVIPLHEEPNYAVMWRPVPGFSLYEASPDGFGPDQQPVHRAGTGKPMAVSVGTNGRPRVKIYDDEGKQRTVEVHKVVMLAYAGECPPGMTVRHYDDDPWNNRWRPGDEAESVAAGGNLFYGSRPEQEADRYRNGRSRPAPRLERRCVRCDAILTTNGKRCHDCVVQLGRDAAPLLRAMGANPDPEEVAAALDYPSAEGIVKLAVVHGGYGAERPGWLHRVAATVRDFFHGGDGSHRK